MENDKKSLSASAVDAVTGLPKPYGTDSLLMSSTLPATSSMIPSSTTGLAALTTAFTTLPAISPTMRNIAGMIGIGLCIRTFPLLKGLCETASTLEVQKMNEDKMRYPCQYCGSCPIWLAAFEPDTGLDTMEKVIESCLSYYRCPLVGQEVENI